MDIQLVRVDINEANDLWEMQVASFLDLYEKYQDTDTSPATESVDKILMRLNQPFTYYYFIKVDDTKVGAIRVVDKCEEGKAKRISPIFIMPEYRNKGLKTRFFDTHRQMLGFVMKSGYTIASIYWKGVCGYICINNYLK